MALVTFTFTVLTLLSLQMVAGVNLEPRGPAMASGGLESFGQEVSPEQQDVFSRSSPPAQARILQERREAALHKGAGCPGGDC